MNRTWFVQAYRLYSDWSSETIEIRVAEIGQPEQMRHARVRIAEHLSQVLKLLFLNVKPAQPSQARWTGIPSVAAFCFGLICYHNLFARLMAAALGKGLSKDQSQQGDQVGVDGPPQAADADVRDSCTGIP